MHFPLLQHQSGGLRLPLRVLNVVTFVIDVLPFFHFLGRLWSCELVGGHACGIRGPFRLGLRRSFASQTAVFAKLFFYPVPTLACRRVSFGRFRRSDGSRRSRAGRTFVDLGQLDFRSGVDR